MSHADYAERSLTQITQITQIWIFETRILEEYLATEATEATEYSLSRIDFRNKDFRIGFSKQGF